MKTCFILLVLFLSGCGPQYVDLPGAHVLVTSSYDGDPEKIVATSKCRPMVNCDNKSQAECAIAHYEASQQFINEGEELISKRLYTSARLVYMQAVCRLEVAKILLNEAKLANFEEYKSVIDLDLENMIKEKIELCDRKLNNLRWM